MRRLAGFRYGSATLSGMAGVVVAGLADVVELPDVVATFEMGMPRSKIELKDSTVLARK